MTAIATKTVPFVRRRALSNSTWYQAHLSSALATIADTDGQLSLFEIDIRPGMEPPAHVHTREAEAIFVLEGRIDGWAGETRIAAGPGEMAVFPNHLPHGWKVTAGESGYAKGLLILAPGAMEDYFLRYSQPAPSLSLPELDDNPYLVRMQADLPRMIADAAAFGIEWMAPGYEPAIRQEAATFAPLQVLGEIFQPLAIASQTDGAFSATLWTSPIASCLPAHIHHDADEAFYVLEGAIEVIAENDWRIVAYPGDLVFLPRGIAHQHRATHDTPSRALQLLTPGGIESALEEVAALGPEEITPDRLQEIAQRGGLTLLA